MTDARPPRWRLGAVIAAHPVLDAYAGFVPPILGVLQVRCDLSAWQAALLLSLGPLMSGGCQPLFAWLSDRTDSRIVGTAGLAVAAAAMSCIGLASTFPALVVIFSLGLLGVGAFHPVAAASAGQLAGRRRSAGVTAFFVAGMAGATVGPMISSRIAAIEPGGFDLLRWTMIPGLIAAVVMHLAVRDASHHEAGSRATTLDADVSRLRWRTVLVLYIGNAMRFSINIALFYVYVRWAEALVQREQPELAVAEIARLGSLYTGQLDGLTMFGMGVGGLGAGMWVRPGRERMALIILPMVFAPAIALFPSASRLAGCGLAVLAGIGYASVIPLTISLAQRLLPHRTSLASSLMMGGAWAFAALAAPAAEWLIGVAGLGATFGAIAGLLAASGLVGLLLRRDVIESVA